MAEDRNSYRSITKSIGIFGGTKVFQIIVGIIKNKIVAVLLGPAGMGIQGLMHSTTNLVSAFSGLGLHTSAVRDVAKATASGDSNRINTTVSILRKLVLFTGIIGTLMVFFFAPLLSQWSFGNDEYTSAFRIISVCLLFDQAVVGQTVLMQGTFHYRYMAMASLWGSVASLIVCIPIYYLWGFKGIVPVIIANSLINLLLSTCYANKVPYQKQKLTLKQVLTGGKVMITLGLAVALAGVVNTGQTYLVRNYISSIGSLEAVGLYTAGSAFVTQYINVIFQAMGSDYSPRLAAASDDNNMFIEVMNKQAVLLVTLVAPLAIIFIVFVKQLIIILYSSKFLPIIGMIEWMMAGMLFRALSWSISYSFTARGESKIFFINELISVALSLLFTVLGYKYLGFTGIGIGFCLEYVFFTLQCYIIAHKLFGFHFSADVRKKCFPMIALFLTCVFVLFFIKLPWLKFVIGILFTILISIISYRWLDEMIGIKSVLSGLKGRLRKNKY